LRVLLGDELADRLQLQPAVALLADETQPLEVFVGVDGVATRLRGSRQQSLVLVVADVALGDAATVGEIGEPVRGGHGVGRVRGRRRCHTPIEARSPPL